MHFSTLMQSIRVRFLILTPICIFLGASISDYLGRDINYTVLSLVFFGALLAHISVHLLNEYSDFKTGLDLRTEKTPFSGGSGALPQAPEALNTIFMVALLCLTGAIGIGLWLVSIVGPGLLPIGLLGIIVVLTYTDWLNKSPLLCLIAPGFGFGILMVLGTHYALTQQLTLTALPVALVPFFLYNNLLLLNQYPDITADQSVGRRHLTIAYGIRAGHIAYSLNLLAIVASVVIAVTCQVLPPLSLFALLPLPLALIALRGAIVHREKIGHHPGYLASNVVMSMTTPLLLSLSLLLA